MAKGIKTGGRVAGTPNKVTAELREAAQAYTAAALEELARLATHAKSEAARVAACRELLDRAHGRAPQGITLAGGVETRPLTVSWLDASN
jgi:hypothetical protein